MIASTKQVDYAISAQQGLDHVGQHLRMGFDIDRCIRHIKNGTGDPKACVMSLGGHAEAACIMSWFEKHDLTQFKQWAYVGGKLQRIVFQKNPKAWYPAYQLWMPLLSDHEQLIRWYAHFENPFDMKRAENHRTPDFHGYQALLAVRGDWDRLARRCERILADPPAKEKKYLIDHRFYLALARGDQSSMESALTELTSPKVARIRNDELAFGYTHFFIGTHAVMYAKIAWRHGYQVKINTPYIPMEWLPIAPLSHYDEPYWFMRTFDIDRPIEV